MWKKNLEKYKKRDINLSTRVFHNVDKFIVK